MRAFFDALLDHDSKLVSEARILEVYLALCNTLEDDDEDIRDQGARVVSDILSMTTSPATDRDNDTPSLSPPAAKKNLLHFVCEGYRSSMLLCMESVRRLTGMSPALDSAFADMQDGKPEAKQGKYIMHLRPVAVLSLEARTTSNVVFVEERQNLYLDTVSEAEGWAGLLSELEPDAWPLSLASALETWTVEGLAYIIEDLQTDIDGALIPTSKPEVFSLFTRVLLAAVVLIRRYGTEERSKEKMKEHVCVGLLQRVLDLGRSRLLHDLLLYRIEEILAEIGSPVS